MFLNSNFETLHKKVINLLEYFFKRSLPAEVLAKLDERLQKMEKLVTGAFIKLES